MLQANYLQSIQAAVLNCPWQAKLARRFRPANLAVFLLAHIWYRDIFRRGHAADRIHGLDLVSVRCLVAHYIFKEKWFFAGLWLMFDLTDFLLVSPNLITRNGFVPRVSRLPLQADHPPPTAHFQLR